MEILFDISPVVIITLTEVFDRAVPSKFLFPFSNGKQDKKNQVAVLKTSKTCYIKWNASTVKI